MLFLPVAEEVTDSKKNWFFSPVLEVYGAGRIL